VHRATILAHITQSSFDFVEVAEESRGLQTVFEVLRHHAGDVGGLKRTGMKQVTAEEFRQDATTIIKAAEEHGGVEIVDENGTVRAVVSFGSKGFDDRLTQFLTNLQEELVAELANVKVERDSLKLSCKLLDDARAHWQDRALTFERLLGLASEFSRAYSVLPGHCMAEHAWEDHDRENAEICDQKWREFDKQMTNFQGKL
jgi:hypothetical protein